jgi:hypothetical protein
MIKKPVSRARGPTRKPGTTKPKSKPFQKKKTTNPTTRLIELSSKKTENGQQAKRVLRLLKKVEERKWTLSKPTRDSINNVIKKINEAEKKKTDVKLTREENEIFHTLL